MNARAISQHGSVRCLGLPLNPLALGWIAACRAASGEEIGQMAVLDTAFYATLRAWPIRNRVKM